MDFQVQSILLAINQITILLIWTKIMYSACLINELAQILAKKVIVLLKNWGRGS